MCKHTQEARKQEVAAAEAAEREAKAAAREAKRRDRELEHMSVTELRRWVRGW